MPAAPIRRKLLRIAGVSTLVLALLVAAACGTVHMTAMSRLGVTVTVSAGDLDIPRDDPTAIERGRYLVDHLMGCKDCHGDDLGGKAIMDNGAMGLWYGPNLTKGRGSAVSGYDGRDWMRALRHGVAKDGRRLFLMPSDDYARLGDVEFGAVVAYLRSLPNVDRDPRALSLGPIARLLVATGEMSFSFDRIDHSARPPEVEPGPTREWGAVLVGSCMGCHGPGLSGGRIPGGDPSWPEASNLSPDPATEIGSWTFDDFDRAMRQGRRPDGRELRDPMPWKAYAGLKDSDLKALWEFLRSAPPRPAGGR